MTPEELGFADPVDFLDFCEANAKSEPAILTGAMAACLCGMAGRNDLAANFEGSMHQTFGFAAASITELVAAAQERATVNDTLKETLQADQRELRPPAPIQGTAGE